MPDSLAVPVAIFNEVRDNIQEFAGAEKLHNPQGGLMRLILAEKPSVAADIAKASRINPET